MSTEERIKQEAKNLNIAHYSQVDDGEAFARKYYQIGALSERNKVIEEVQQMLKDMVSRQTLSPFDKNRIFNKLESLKV